MATTDTYRRLNAVRAAAPDGRRPGSGGPGRRAAPSHHQQPHAPDHARDGPDEKGDHTHLAELVRVVLEAEVPRVVVKRRAGCRQFVADDPRDRPVDRAGPRARRAEPREGAVEHDGDDRAELLRLSSLVGALDDRADGDVVRDEPRVLALEGDALAQPRAAAQRDPARGRGQASSESVYASLLPSVAARVSCTAAMLRAAAAPSNRIAGHT